MTRTADEVLDELREVGEAIATAEAALGELYPRRRALFYEGKAQDPPIVNRVLGEAAGCEENAVVAVFRKDRQRQAKAGKT